jgi:replicative DNA helicase
MLDTSILKSLLNYEFYEQNKGKLNRKLFADEIRSLYTVLIGAHETYQHDLTSKELYKIWETENPVSTRAERAEIEDVLSLVDMEEEYSPAVATDVISKLWQRDVGKQIATLGLEISEGNPEALQRAQEVIEKYSNGFVDDEFGPNTTQDIDELILDMDNSNRAKFNIETLSRRVYGIQRTEFGIIFAISNVGKTAFVVSLALAPGGFVDQGHKVVILGNEESTRRTVARAYSAATGLTKEEVLADSEKAKVIYNARARGLIEYIDTQDWDLDKIERYIKKEEASIVFIDQADKVTIGGNFNASHERLREVYRRIREVAKRQNCAIFGVSQASAEAEGKTRLSFTMMEGSKIGKASEADLIIGIGKLDVDPDDEIRHITISKNKISGWHGTIAARIHPQISRYTE